MSEDEDYYDWSQGEIRRLESALQQAQAQLTTALSEAEVKRLREENDRLTVERDEANADYEGLLLQFEAGGREYDSLLQVLRSCVGAGEAVSYGPNLGEAMCWCSEDYCAMLPSPRGHSRTCDAMRAALALARPLLEEGGNT